MNKDPSQNQIKILLKVYESGNFKEFEKQAFSLTKNFPNSSYCWKALGIALKLNGRTSEALSANKKSLEINPNDPEAHYNLGNTMKELNNFLESVKSYKKAISLNPNYAEAYNNLGVALKELGKLKESENNYKKAISLNPNYAEAYNNLGVALKELGKLKESENNYKKAISLNPNYAGAYNNLGIIFKDQGILSESLTNYKKAISLNPNYAEAYNNLGMTLRELGKLKESEDNYKKAISLNPNYADAYYNLGITKRDLGKLNEAITANKNAIKINQNYVEAYNNLGLVLKDLGKLDESEDNYKKAILLNPNYADAYNNLSFTKMLQKNFREAFKLSEWRWKTNQNVGKRLITNKPIWKGERDKSIFIWKEQGIGDEIMFFSTLKEAIEISKKIIVNCDKRLIPLFKRSFNGNVIFENDIKKVDEKEYDYHLPVGSLPSIFRNNLESFSNSSKGYLKADKVKASEYRKKLLNGKNLKLIGISWQTKSNIQMASFRNIALNDLVLKLNRKNTKLINLQYGDTSDEISNLKKNTGIEIVSIEGLDKKNDLDGIASLMSACDLVVTIDNYTVHLAGSLGLNTKVLLPSSMDARWGIEGKKSHLYNSINLYRQENLGNWSKVLKELKYAI